MRAVFHSDNLGVVFHGNTPRRQLPEKQAQGDVLRVLKRLITSLGCPVELKHVFAHLDEALRRDQMEDEEWLNCEADKIASDDLVEAVAAGKFIKSEFPFEDMCLTVNGVKVTGSPRRAISSFWGSKVARELFNGRRIVNRYDFNLIYWDGMEPVLLSFPELWLPG